MRINKRLKIFLFIVFGFLIVSTVCFYLTVKYSKPTNGLAESSEVDRAKQTDFNNCVIVRKEKATLVIAHKETDINYTTIANELPDKLKATTSIWNAKL